VIRAKYKQAVVLGALAVLIASLLVVPTAPLSQHTRARMGLTPDSMPATHVLEVSSPSSLDGSIHAAAMTAFNLTTRLSGTAADQVTAVAVDDLGYIYICGYTTSTDLLGTPVNPLQETHAGSTDAFFLKMHGANHTIVYSSYYGGELGDYLFDVAVDNDTQLMYMVGYTDSNVTDHGFTVSGNANQSEPASSSFDAFILVVNSTGDLYYSSYFGGLGTDRAYGLALDQWGTAYVVGETESSISLPWGGVPENSTFGGGTLDSFLFSCNVTAGTVPYSSYILNGAGEDKTWSVAVINETAYNNVTIGYAGITDSGDIPTTTGAYSSILYTTAHAVQYHRIDSNVGSISYSTYLGGTLSATLQPEETPSVVYDSGLGALVFASAVPYVATPSEGHPYTSGAPQKTIAGGEDGWIGWLDAVGYGQGTSDLLCATFVGGQTEDYVWDLDVNSLGEVYIVGESESADYPLRGPSDRTFERPVESQRDIFISRFTRPVSRGTDLNYSTLHSLGEWDSAWGVACVTDTGDPIVVSQTQQTGDPQDIVIETITAPTKPRLWDITAITNVSLGDDVRVIGRARRDNDLEGAEIDSVTLSVRHTNGSTQSSDADEKDDDYWWANVTVDDLTAARWEFVVRTEDGGYASAIANLTIYTVSEETADEDEAAGPSVQSLVDFLGEYGWFILAILIIALGIALGALGKGLNVPGLAINAAAMAVYIMTSMWGLPGALELWQSIAVFAFGMVAAQSVPLLGVAGIPVVVAAAMTIMAVYTLVMVGIGWTLFAYVMMAAGGVFVSLFALSPDYRLFIAAMGTWMLGLVTAFAPAIPGVLSWITSLIGIGG
jgi:hypothetical protein